jgi:hypothetical protein
MVISHCSHAPADWIAAMRKIPATLFCFVLLLCGREATAAAPAQLYGKSVIVSWTGTQNERQAGTHDPFRPVNFQKQPKVYISTAGRTFLHNSTTNRGGSDSIEQVGASGPSQTGGTSLVQFQGRSLVFTFVFIGGAIRIQADFDPSFTSCTASVIRGIGAGNGTMTIRNLVGGNMVEVQSPADNGVTCSIRDGNVLAE